MMGYKVGDEVLVKAKIIENGASTYRLKFPDDVCITISKKHILPVHDMTAEEAWEIANRITASTSHGELNVMELVEIFGTASYGEIFKQNTPSEAKAKIEAWEAEKEIKVGDVVKDCNGKIGVVVSKGTSDNVIFGDGSTWNYTERTLEKTGRHIDIDGLLKQIGGDE